MIQQAYCYLDGTPTLLRSEMPCGSFGDTLDESKYYLGQAVWRKAFPARYGIAFIRQIMCTSNGYEYALQFQSVSEGDLRWYAEGELAS